MSDLMNIGRSGLLAYRTALGVVGENIANVDTKGYLRRDTLLAEGPGGGVETVDITRAFDAMLVARNREALSHQAAAQTHLTHLRTLEDRMLPGVEGVNQLMTGFFDALDGVSLAPSDPGLRAVALAAGDTLASGIADLAIGLDRLSGGIAAETDRALTDLGAVLQTLGQVQEQIAAADRMGAQNPLFDQRDLLLDDLARLVQVDVTLDARGIATVRMGAGGGGPVLLTGARAASIEAAPQGQIRVIPADQAVPAVVRSPAGGVLGGLAQAAGSVGQTIRDIDAWASQIASQMNTLHGQGLTPDGAPGGVMFTTTGWQQTAGALMRGTAVADLVVTDIAALPQGPLTLIYDAGQAEWDLRDGAGLSLGRGAQGLTVAGLQITLSGTPRDGDRITLHRQDGAARHMAFALPDTRAIAAAGPLVVSAAPTNQGTAQLAVQPVTPVPDGLADLTGLLTGEATEFLSPGVVGVIPAGGGAVALSVQPRLTTFEIAPADPATATGLAITTATATYDLAWPAGTALDAVVSGLNAGTMAAADGTRLRDLGLTAGLVDGGIALFVDEGGTPPVALALATSAGPVAAQIVADAAPAADLAVFTRDGRQLAGAPLSAAAAAALLTPANGFAADAVYRSDYLDPASDFAGLARAQSAAAGDYSHSIGAADGIIGWLAGTLPPEAPASTLRFEADGWLHDLTLPVGANAARRADLVNAALPVAAEAQTALALDLPATGSLSFRLAGLNVTPVPVSADLGAGGAAALASAVNAVAATTGIRAELSSDGARLRLIQAEGADITLTQIRHSAALPVGLQRLGPDGAVLDATSLSTAGDAAVRVAGVVTLAGAGAFAITENGTLATATRDPFRNGLIAVARSDAGSVARLTPAVALQDDAAPRSFRVTGGDGRDRDAAVSAVGLDGAALASALLRDLRSTAPTSRLTGAPLASLPADGSSLRIGYGEQSYQVQMIDGAPVVTGPEPDRITARFDATNRLVLETPFGALDGAALVLPPDSGEAARFGLGLADAPQSVALGQPVDPADLPASFQVTLGGQSYLVDVTGAGVTVGAGFPGSGSLNATTGAVELRFDARAGAFGIPAQPAAARAGFDTADLRATRDGATLVLTATDGRDLQISAPATGSGTTLRLAERPDLDLLVVLSGPGALRLSGTASAADPAPRAQEIRLLDASAGRVGLFDTQSGAFLAERRLGPDGTARFGGLQIGLGAGAVTGDIYRIAPNTALDGDSTIIEALANLRQRDPLTGAGGYAAGFASLQTRVGGQVAASQMRLTSLEAESESAARALSNRAGVDLDAEAARMMQMQQAYQANAQSMKTARDIFDTLLAAL